MTKSTITRERVVALIAEHSYDSALVDALEHLLAAMDSEPVAIVEPSDYVTAAQLVGEGPARKAVHELYEGALRIGDKLYRHAQPAQTPVDDDVRNIIGLLETNEWAEHCTETVLGSRLEAEITRLVDSAQPVGCWPAPVVPEEATPDTIEILASARRRDHAVFQWDEDQRNAAADSWNACRAAMLQGAEPVTTAYKLPFEQWLSQQTGTIDVECGCVMTEVFFHWLRVAYEAGNSPVIPGWVPVSERMPEVGVKVLCYPVGDEPIHATFDGQLWLQDVSWSGSDEPIDNVIPVSVTHWMPLPAAPQEVK